MTRYRAIAIGLVLAVGLASCTSAEKAKRQALEQGNKAFDERRFQDAIFLYRTAIAKDERFGEARLKLSEAYLAAGNAEGSYKELLRAADLMPEDTAVQLKAGGYLLVARQFEDAQTRARMILDRDPKNVDALILLGNALAGLNDIRGAVAQIQDAVALDSNRPGAYENLAVL